jgi:hypothetical protein
MERVEHLFVVRIWREAGANDRDAWRGSVEHVATGARRYFAALAELDAFILRSTGDWVRVDDRREGA